MKIKKGFVLRKMCGENIITAEGMENINFNKLISLNSTAAFLWEQLEGKEFDPETMAEMLVREYGIDGSRARTDAENLCAAWINAGIAE
ncbi:MAG: PqqD family protein [Bacteroidales bacterium]|nr:PqqD family protein [Bacteroidales bacterium]